MFKSASNGLKGLDIKSDVYKPWILPCFIIDDTDIVKRGRTIEFIGKMHSHVFHKWNFGFKGLNLYYWSDKNLLHLDFTFHKELGKDGKQGLKASERRKWFSKSRVKWSYGEQRATHGFLVQD